MENILLTIPRKFYSKVDIFTDVDVYNFEMFFYPLLTWDRKRSSDCDKKAMKEETTYWFLIFSLLHVMFFSQRLDVFFHVNDLGIHTLLSKKNLFPYSNIVPFRLSKYFNPKLLKKCSTQSLQIFWKYYQKNYTFLFKYLSFRLDHRNISPKNCWKKVSREVFNFLKTKVIFFSSIQFNQQFLSSDQI